MPTPNQVETLIKKLTIEIQRIPGVTAVVLGGSRARGTQTNDSDIDLGIYYDSNQQALDVAALNHIARQFDDKQRPDLLTQPGGWGPWINGGGWLQIEGIPVDFLYRDLQKVSRVLNDCCQGRVEMVYQPGHPHGFVSSIYLSEIAVCQTLWEGSGWAITNLKAQVNPYPLALQRALIEKFAWEIDFSLKMAHKGVTRRDVVYTTGCCYRASACLIQTLFALNKQYWLNEKGAVAMLESQPLRPADFRNRIEAAFSALDNQSVALDLAVEILNGLLEETAPLVERTLSIRR